MNPNQVPIQYTLNIDQVNLVLNGLGKLPYEQVGDFVSAFRNVALQALAAAEAKAKADAEAQSKDEEKPVDDGKPSDVE